MPGVRKTTVGIAAVALGLGGAYAIASVPDGNGTIHACIERQAGAQVPAVQVNVRVIDTAAGQTCDAASEFALDWSQAGPQGPAGAQGPQGPQGPPGADGTLTITRQASLPTAGQIDLSGLGTFDVEKVALLQHNKSAPEVEFLRPADKLSPKFMLGAASGAPFATGTVRIYKPGTTTVASTVKLTQVLVTSFQTLSDGERVLNDVLLDAKTLKVAGGSSLLPAIQFKVPKVQKGA